MSPPKGDEIGGGSEGRETNGRQGEKGREEEEEEGEREREWRKEVGEARDRETVFCVCVWGGRGQEDQMSRSATGYLRQLPTCPASHV